MRMKDLSKKLMMLYGRNSVLERLKVNPKSINKVFLQDKVNLERIEQLIQKTNVLFERVPLKKLSRIKHAKDLQGVVAQVEKINYVSLEDLLQKEQEDLPSLLFLDRINDPQNLGVIIRIAAVFGKFAVVIPSFGACEVTEAVLHVASGGENYIDLVMVNNLSNAITKVKQRGYWIVGAQLDEHSQDINKVELPFPLGLVLGSEGDGIRYGITKQLDMKLRIPMQGAKLSFNVATACTIFCHEITKQRAAFNETQKTK